MKNTVSFPNFFYILYLLAGFVFFIDLLLRRMLNVDIPLLYGWSILIILSLLLFILAIAMMASFQLIKKIRKRIT